MSVLRRLLAGGLIALLLGCLPLAGADELETRRIKTSLAIFPRIVAVDENIDAKLDPTRRVQLVVAYSGDSVSAQSHAGILSASVQNIGGRPLDVRALSARSLLSADPGVVSGLFLAEKLEQSELDRLLAFARARHIIVFSPFSGDVERGVTVGIAVGSQVKPYFNLQALRSAEISINPTLLRISKHYE